MRGLTLLILTGCAGGAAGDWNATSASSDDGDIVISGILEIDRDGEVLLQLTFAGDGFSGALDGDGVGSVSGTSATFVIAADWTAGGQTTPVTVSATCDAASDALSCDTDVEGESWTVDFVRESGADLID